IETTTGLPVSRRKRRSSLKSSCDAATPPPGELMRTTTALMFGASWNLFSMSRKRSAERIIPSRSTTPTRPPRPREGAPPRGANTRAAAQTISTRNANATAATIHATVERFTRSPSGRSSPVLQLLVRVRSGGNGFLVRLYRFFRRVLGFVPSRVFRHLFRRRLGVPRRSVRSCRRLAGGLFHVAGRKPDALFLRLAPEALHAQRVTLGVVRGRLLSAPERGFGNVHEALEPFVQAHEHAELGHLRDRAVHDVAGLVLRRELLPFVGSEFLDRQTDSPVLDVDGREHGLHLVALLEDLGRVLHAAAPGHVGDVDEAVDALLDLHERAEVGQVANRSVDAISDVIFLGELLPRVRLGGAKRERETARLGIHVRDDGLDRVAHVQKLRRILDPLRPGHLALVNEPLDTLFEAPERG